MILARIEFKPGRGAYFCEGSKQDVIEIVFDSPQALIQTLKDLEDDLVNCTAQINGKILDLRNISGIDTPA